MGRMSRAGWYPDPGGAPGMYRYWDGTAWSPTLTSDQYAAAGGGQPLSSRRPMANPYAGASGQHARAQPEQERQRGDQIWRKTEAEQ